MPSEWEKVVVGALYDPLDRELVSARERARDLCVRCSMRTREAETEKRRGILGELFGAGGDTVRTD